MVWTAAGGVRKNIKAKMLNITLVTGLIASLAVASLTPLFGSRAFAATTVNSQAELVAAIASTETVINIGSDFSVTSQVNINRDLTLNGNGRTISTSYTATGGGNDTAIAVVGGNPTINNLVVDGAGGVGTQGIQVWQSAATLNNITSRNNDKAGIHVNDSDVTVFNVTTSNNGSNYGGILVSGNSIATINGTSTHNENLNTISGQIMDIYLNIFRPGGSIVDTNSQYNKWLGIVYTLKPVVDTEKPVVSNISISPTINGNIGRTITIQFDLNDATGVDLTKTRVLFADGPNLPNRAKESSKYTPVLISGNTYKVVIDTTTFLSQNYTGNYNLGFNLWDVLGNQGSSKPAEFRSILIDNSGPTATLIAPISGSVVNSIKRFTFNITDHSSVSSAYMKLNGPSSKTINLINGSGNEWYADVDTSTVPDGNYTIDVRPIDVFGTARYNANRGNVTIDNSAPVWNNNPVHESPVNGASVTEGSNILMQWTDASDPNGVNYYYEVSYSNQTNGPGGSFVNPIWTFGPLTSSEHDGTGTVAGNYFWHVKACDDLGNCTPWTDPWGGSVVAEQINQPNSPATGGGNTLGATTGGNTLVVTSGRSGAVQGIGGNNQGFNQTNTLGGDSQDQEDDAGEVEGANVENDFASIPATLAAADVNEQSGCTKIFGLCWYYWPPIIVAVLTLGYIIYRKTQTEN